MSLQNKIFSIIAATMLGLICAFDFMLHQVLSSQFSALETSSVSRDVMRAKKALLDEVNQLEFKAADWAKWDDTYKFMADKNKQYADSNLLQESLEALKIDDVLYYDAAGRYYYSAAEKINGKKKSASAPSEVRTFLESHPEIRQLDSEEASRRGVVITPGGVSLISALPILQTDGSGPVRGTIIFSKGLSGELIAKLASQAELKVRYERIDQLPAGNGEAKIAQTLAGDQEPIIRPESESQILGFGMLNDISGKPGLLVRVREAREIYQQGKKTLSFLVYGLLISSLVVLLVLLIFLNHTVISRLHKLSKEVTQIGSTSDSTQRVTATGRDELSATAAAVNKMLESLQEYEHRLEVAKLGAERANRARAHFVATISHEVRTPANGILGLTQVLLGFDQPAEQRQCLEMIRESGLALMEVINDVLDLSKIEAGKIELERLPVSINSVVREALQIVAVRAAERGLEVNVSVDPEMPDAYWGDGPRLRQVLLNLLNNAVKFTEKGQIQVSICLEDQPASASDPDSAALHWAVKDSGIGIPADRIERVFEAFTQADSATTRRFGGTGLGLTISKQIVETMGGKIWAESTMGAGSTFHFTTPLHFRSHDPLAYVPDGQNCSIMLIDPSRSFTALTSRFLQRAGFPAVAVQHTFDGTVSEIEMLSRHSVIVLDGTICQPEQLRLIFEAPALKPVRKIVTLPPLSLDLGRLYRELGAYSIILKPLVQADLVRAICGEKTSAPVEQGEAEGAQATGAPLKILIADDIAVNQRVLELLLAPYGHRLTKAFNGIEVLRLLEEAGYFEAKGDVPFDVILMDSQMPGMDGPTAARTIRERERYNGGHLPIIAVTAESAAGDREQLLANGMDDYLTKPVKRGALLDKLKAIAVRPIDWEALQTRFGDADIVREIVCCFQEEHDGLVGALEEAIGSEDAENIRRAAHALKGSLQNVGAMDAAITAELIESSAKKSELASVKNGFKELQAKLVRAKSEICRYQASNPA